MAKHPIHKHSVHDTDEHFIIDPITRTITNANLRKTYLIQYDHNSERFSIEIPKIIEDHDMTLCDKIEVHYTNVDSSSREQNVGVYEVDDIEECADGQHLVFTWLISENATMYKGTLSFLVLFACTDTTYNDEGEQETVVTYRWHTGINTSIAINQGMNNGEAIVEEYPDILAQWRAELLSKNYSYEAAVQNGFEGTEEDWYNDIISKASDENVWWNSKQNTLAWLTEEEIDDMFTGTYIPDEDSDGPEYTYPTFEVVGEMLVVEDGGDA